VSVAGERRPANEPPAAEPTVFVVDDDESVRKGIGALLRSVGLRVETFATAPEFLAIRLPRAPCCLVLDVRLPGLSGLDFQARLASANIAVPIIFITGHGDIPMTVRAMKAGAVEFLTKPFRHQDLLDAVQTALERDKERLRKDETVAQVRARFETLTPREQDVMAGVTRGLLNKQVAAEIGVTEATVKIYRRSVISKMGASSVADLVRMADLLGAQSRNP